VVIVTVLEVVDLVVLQQIIQLQLKQLQVDLAQMLLQHLEQLHNLFTDQPQEFMQVEVEDLLILDHQDQLVLVDQVEELLV
jgi:hypothetical protein